MKNYCSDTVTPDSKDNSACALLCFLLQGATFFFPSGSSKRHTFRYQTFQFKIRSYNVELISRDTSEYSVLFLAGTYTVFSTLVDPQSGKANDQTFELKAGPENSFGGII